MLHYLEEGSREFNWQLTTDVFRRELEAGHCLILLDGLDEAPDSTTREKMSSLAEWERAARGPGEEYRKYPWGNKEPTGETANFDKSNIGHITPVGIFPDSCLPEGVIDLAGNVWEWCWDWFSEEYYKTCAQQGLVKDPRGPEEGDGRVVRGGSFDYDPLVLRCAVRDRKYPLVRSYDIGFRVVRGAQS